MSRSRWRPSRRAFLGSALATIALPLLPSLDSSSLGGPARTSAQEEEQPKRFVAIYSPGGTIQGGRFHDLDQWTAGSAFERLDDPRHILHSVREYKSELIQVQNCQWQGYWRGMETGNIENGAIGHWGEHPGFLTGSALLKRDDNPQWTSIEVDDESIDRKIARRTGHRPLNLAISPHSSYATLDALSWQDQHIAEQGINDPMALFTAVFGSEDERADRERFANLLLLRRSVLDEVGEERGRLERSLARADRHHLQAYFTNLRETEIRLGEARSALCEAPEVALFDTTNKRLHPDLLVDLALIALECDMTRVVTLSAWGAGGGTGGQVSGSFIPGLVEPLHDYHYYTHFATAEGLDARYEDFSTATRWAGGLMGRFVQRLGTTADLDGNTMLHNSLVMFGSAIGDSAHHEYRNAARVFAGRAGGLVQPGRVLTGRAPDAAGHQAPIENVLPEILDLFDYRQMDGSPQTSVGLSDGILSLR